MPENKTIESAMNILSRLEEKTGERVTEGLSKEIIEKVMEDDDELIEAVHAAAEAYDALPPEEKSLLENAEEHVCEAVQEKYVNFYPDTGINPYVPLSAKGPWIVTCHGAVLHDTGGYGMTGLGHNPESVLNLLGKPHVMANVMTPSLNQKRFAGLLEREIGHKRGRCPFARFICLNSGSESVALTARIADIHAKNKTEKGARYYGWNIRTLALSGGFHGRTERPARLSESTRDAYEESLASFDEDTGVDFVAVNDIGELEKAFGKAREKKIYYHACYIEPVMGEGISGLAVTREYYDAVRRFTRQSDSLLIVDSIQAALRAQGCLSIVDYPGFTDCDPPDMETYSKALNAGQYPLSVIALSEKAADIYVTGVYGNTMTTNPKALETGCAVLSSIDENMRNNIRERGCEFTHKLEKLGEEFPEALVSVNGTGLMLCAELNPERYKVTGAGGFEEFLRKNGIEMIHGGENGLRFTPHFNINSEQIDMIISLVRQGLAECTQADSVMT